MNTTVLPITEEWRRDPNLCYSFSFLAPDGNRQLSRTMTGTPVARRINEALPEDVFGVIFEEHAKMDWRAPLIDGQVCRQWRQTILRSPRAWSYLKFVRNFTSAPSQLLQWLDRSGSAPLHIQSINWVQGVEEFLDSHCKRIESLSLYRFRLAFLENRSFPILQSLTIGAWSINAPLIRWSAWSAMPELRYFRASYIWMDALPSNNFPALRVLALYRVDSDYLIRNSYHSLTSLMLDRISLKYTMESLEFPSLRFLSLFEVKNIKHRMNVPTLTTYHESDKTEQESFSVSLPFLIEYGIYRSCDNPPLNVTKLHQCYPNIIRLSVRFRPFAGELFLHSLSRQPTALPMLRILAVGTLAAGTLYDYTKYSQETKNRMKNDVFMRNMVSSVKMELCFDGMARVPLYFASVRACIDRGRSKLTPTLRTRISPIEGLSFVLGLWLRC